MLESKRLTIVNGSISNLIYCVQHVKQIVDPAFKTDCVRKTFVHLCNTGGSTVYGEVAP